MTIEDPKQPQDDRRFRRRRAVAGVALLALVALLITALSSTGGGGHGHAASASGAATRRATAARLTPAEREARMHAAEEGAVDAVLSYTPAVTSGGGKGHELALTFDDGPGPYTVQLVNELNRLHVHATFFAIGEEERYFSAGTKLELRSGDVVGDHTETHPMMASLSAHDQREEL